MLARAALILLSCLLTVNMVAATDATPENRLCSGGKIVGILVGGAVIRTDPNGTWKGEPSGKGCQCSSKGFGCLTAPKSGYLPTKTPTTCVKLDQPCN
ncbi:hypothetical protein PGT21_008808 [Puccinia graminis f. sp. tritici]|uniref:Uncharacterized protein n=2 Tax=Puccinia graminis f. sp. tritici TaxID=56615 RepID=H6QSL5_PUCGT|nr:uncharacterized protein PGTG_22586 [Puccinia graminis f. sp. tritici CRL 75-36-700-3]XP_003889496.1 uncharacterized protein PGTG_21829 [Puccinia graminis f. sp. tritici CRL 75-36-700-3]KAA1074524.1 hypothetical protein PGT21_008808 [Puccinia graminis f. sp. tritici]EHS62587.1 hypothetical protein PGTG_22586 [Puccinia graminis f. sp. tritici CRL 75-36-700-3]EHS63737.1 hypothetical protein PGTG_21829 [Puccinia graminis f. sp. tritici CRL 75-36-700-3]KAA1116048.1 hypothetical protein PGTUg99_0